MTERDLVQQVPTLADIYRLAMHSPELHHCLVLQQQSVLTFEQALMLAIVLLAKKTELLEQQLTQLLARTPGPGPSSRI